MKSAVHNTLWRYVALISSLLIAAACSRPVQGPAPQSQSSLFWASVGDAFTETFLCEFKQFKMSSNVSGGYRYQLSQPVDLAALANRLHADSDYELACPDDHSLRISRKYGAIEYDLTFINLTKNDKQVSTYWFNSHGTYREDGEPCSTPDDVMMERMYQIIRALSLEAAEEDELMRNVSVIRSNWAAADELYWETQGSCEHLISTP